MCCLELNVCFVGFVSSPFVRGPRKKLISLEVISGGGCMGNAAIVHYIMQFT